MRQVGIAHAAGQPVTIDRWWPAYAGKASQCQPPRTGFLYEPVRNHRQTPAVASLQAGGSCHEPTAAGTTYAGASDAWTAAAWPRAADAAAAGHPAAADAGNLSAT